MNLAFQRKVDRFFGALICRLLSLFSTGKKHMMVKGKPDKILFILLSEMGSLVLTMPMMKRVEKKYPNASVYFLVFHQNREVVTIIYPHKKNHILTIRNNNLFIFLKDIVQVIFALRKENIHTVIDCELFSRVSSILSYLSGAVVRSGFHPQVCSV